MMMGYGGRMGYEREPSWIHIGSTTPFCPFQIEEGSTPNQPQKHHETQ